MKPLDDRARELGYDALIIEDRKRIEGIEKAFCDSRPVTSAVTRLPGTFRDQYYAKNQRRFSSERSGCSIIHALSIDSCHRHLDGIDLRVIDDLETIKWPGK